MMKRTVSLLLAVILLFTMFSGCAEKEPEPLRICIDLDATDSLTAPRKIQTIFSFIWKK
ncbi:MAG: hypothetical protein J6I98_04705 [Clostridia bacterium]|nr:hypothetical protein [Clostridia bacterium]